MSNNRITPFVKRLRINGGTIYTFSSAVEDIGINISERKNDVAIKHFALLDIPPLYRNANDVSVNANRFNIIDMLGTFHYEENSPTIKDGRLLIAESFENYALNLEANILNQTTYNPALLKTVSERVFWKWLKESGAIRWTYDGSTNYFIEEPEVTNGYTSVVKYVGISTTGNLRTDTFGTFNETYLQVPTSHGKTHVFWENISDDNYYYEMEIPNGATSILGRESYVKPHPDGLSLNAYYDYIDSIVSVSIPGGGSYDLYYYDDFDVLKTGWWFTDEGLTITGTNCYLIDSSTYTIDDYNTKLRYEGEPSFEFVRSKIDCLSIVNNINDLTAAYNSLYGNITELSYDDMAITYAINDDFTFNTVLIYYDVFNKTGNLDTTTTPLATNLLGVLFLDAPVTTSDTITIPSLEKIQSTSYGFGNSYSFRVNIKSDNMVDDTAATIVDMTTNNQTLVDDFSNIFDELHRAVEVLNAQTGIINNISTQQNNVYNQYSSLLNIYNGGDVFNTTSGLSGAEGANIGTQGYGIYSSTTNSNNISTLNFKKITGENAVIITNKGDYLSIDVSVALLDVSLGPLYQSVTNLQAADNSLYSMIMNVSTNAYNYSSNVSTNLYNYKVLIASYKYVKEASLGPVFVWGDGSLGITFPAATADVTKAYVDASIAKFVRSASMGYGFIFNGTSKQWDITDYVSKTYVDGSLATKISKTYIDGSLGKFIRSASLGTTLWWNSTVFDVDVNYIHNSSLGPVFTWSGGKLTIDVTLGSGSTPGGEDRSIQYNNGGTFDGSTYLKWTNTNSLYLTDDYYNVAIGYQVLYKGSSNANSFNVAIGQGALRESSVGWYNIAIGTNTLRDSSSASYNIALGREAGRYLLNDYNIAIGAYALTTGVSSSSNIAIGNYNLYTANDSRRNIAIGDHTLYSLTTGIDNVAIGINSLYNNDSNHNIAIGNYTLYNNISGAGNIGIGHNVGNYNINYFKESNRLIIDNSSTNIPLIYGKFDNKQLIFNASVGIGNFMPNDTSVLAGVDIRSSIRLANLPSVPTTYNDGDYIPLYIRNDNSLIYADYHATNFDNLKTYVDGSLNARDVSIEWLNDNKASTIYVDSTFIKSASLGNGLEWDNELFNVIAPLEKIEQNSLTVGAYDLNSYTAASYNFAHYAYLIMNSGSPKTNLRAGTFTMVNNTTSAESYQVSTADIGNTSDVVLSAVVSTGMAIIRATISLGGAWDIKLIRMQI